MNPYLNNKDVRNYKFYDSLEAVKFAEDRAKIKGEPQIICLPRGKEYLKVISEKEYGKGLVRRGMMPKILETVRIKK